MMLIRKDQNQSPKTFCYKTVCHHCWYRVNSCSDKAERALSHIGIHWRTTVSDFHPMLQDKQVLLRSRNLLYIRTLPYETTYRHKLYTAFMFLQIPKALPKIKFRHWLFFSAHCIIVQLKHNILWKANSEYFGQALHLYLRSQYKNFHSQLVYQNLYAINFSLFKC